MVSSIVLPQQSKEINPNGLAHLIHSEDSHSVLLKKEKKKKLGMTYNGRKIPNITLFLLPQRKKSTH